MLNKSFKLNIQILRKKENIVLLMLHFLDGKLHNLKGEFLRMAIFLLTEYIDKLIFFIINSIPK